MIVLLRTKDITTPSTDAFEIRCSIKVLLRVDGANFESRIRLFFLVEGRCVAPTLYGNYMLQGLVLDTKGLQRSGSKTV